MDAFHKLHPHVSLLVNVTRHPFSFVGDSKVGFFDQTSIDTGLDTWDAALIRDNYPKDAVVQPGKQAGLPAFDFNVRINNAQPIDSQRMLMWAGRFGKQELYMSAVNKRHFHERKSAAMRSTVLEAAQEAGIDLREATAFLDTDELHSEVLRSYRSTIYEKGIHAIPLFVFNSPLTDGGPFRSGRGRAEIVHGSGSADQFLKVFERLFTSVAAKTPFPDGRENWQTK